MLLSQSISSKYHESDLFFACYDAVLVIMLLNVISYLYSYCKLKCSFNYRFQFKTTTIVIAQMLHQKFLMLVKVLKQMMSIMR